MTGPLSVRDINTNPDYTLNYVDCRLLLNEQNECRPHGNGRVYMSTNGDLYFVSEDRSYYFEIEDESTAGYVKDAFYRQYANLASVIELQTKTDGHFALHVVFFPEEKNFLRLNIILSGKVRKTLAEKNFNNLAKLKRRMILKDGITDNACFVYSAFSQTLSDEIADKEEMLPEVEKNPAPKKSVNAEETLNCGKLQSVMIMYGNGCSLQVGVYLAPSTDDFSDDETLAVAEKIIFAKVNVPCQRLGTATEINFVDERRHSADTVRRLFDKSDTYVSVWSKYAELEGQFLLKKMQMLSKLQFSQEINFDSDGTILVTVTGSEEMLKYLKVGDNLSSLEEVPAYVTNPAIKWEDYKNELAATRLQKRRKKSEEDNDNAAENSETVYSVEKIFQNKVWLKVKKGSEPKDKLGKLYWNEYSYRMQIERRERARENISHGLSANPRLGIIIGMGKDAVKNVNRLSKPVYQEHIEPFSASMIKEFTEKKRMPNETQRHAVEIALNTPDIAIIQGPPGTGKTTVITAILERLNEILGKNGANKGEVLITSLQHDAVRNVTQRVQINSLPIVKFGGSNREKEGSDQDIVIAKWCEDLSEKIREKNPQLKETAEQKMLALSYETYATNSTRNNARRFLQTALSVSTSPELRGQINAMLEKYQQSDAPRDNSALTASARRLWTTPRAFRDGGSYHAAILLNELKELLPNEEGDNAFIFATLEKAAAWNREHPKEDIDEDFRAELRKCQRLILQLSVPLPRYQLEEPDEDIIALYQQVKREAIRPESETDNILYGFLNNLDYNRQSIKEALKNYMFAYAATTQQSDSKAIDNVKNVDRRKGDFPQYDTVIVDEAARVNPGDLMIPLSQAKRRIILVGDHRQLPHMYDQDIFDEMVENGEETDTEKIKQALEDSMFEYLLETAKKLNQQDGVERFITLNIQYRMHPLLGKFVSDNFYACHDTAEAFGSELSAELFRQPFYREPMLWIDVDVKKPEDTETKSGTSWMRRKEAEIIIERLHKMAAQMPPGKPLSIGVISFYRGQVNYIDSLVQKDETLSGLVRVGTVDSYQGMEYDIIFLSTVRTQLYKADINWDAVENAAGNSALQREHDKIGRKHYGFLTSENRLCVALSRQKRLLIVVGNKDLFSGNIGGRLAAAYVPALKKFYEMCEERGAVEHE